MFASILTALLPLVHSGADVSVRVRMAPGVLIAFHDDSYYHRREAERRAERERILRDRERERREQERWERCKPADHWRNSPWHERREEWERERAQRDRVRLQRENARLARIHFLEVEEARDREEHRLALERRLREERREDRRAEETARPAPSRNDVRVQDDHWEQGRGTRSIND